VKSRIDPGRSAVKVKQSNNEGRSSYGGDLASTGVKKSETRAEPPMTRKNKGKDTKANDNVELALAA
jgi:hypothetical protein